MVLLAGSQPTVPHYFVQKVLISTNKKGLPDGRPLCSMVRLAGIEPTTPWFVAKDTQGYKTYINQ